MTPADQALDPAKAVIVKKGWAETIDTLCGVYVTVGEDGPYLEETEAAVRAELEDLAKTKTTQFLEDIQEGRFDIADEESVMEMREEGLSDQVIAAQLAEDDVAEYDAARVGIDTDGNVWQLDEDDKPLHTLQRPDR